MREALIEGLIQLLGAPDPEINQNEKVHRWNVSSTLDVIVQRDASADIGVVWVSDLAVEKSPAWSEVYAADKTRHSATYHLCPTMIEGKPVRRIEVSQKGQVGETIRFIQSLKQAKPNALAKPSSAGKQALSGFFAAMKFVPPIPVVKNIKEWVEYAAGMAGAIEEAEHERKLRNLEALVESLKRGQKFDSKRIEEVQEKLAESGLADAFASTISKALADDEVEKQPIYAAVLDWIADGIDRTTNPRLQATPLQIRMISHAVQELSYLELSAMLQQIELGSGRPMVQPFMDENLFYRRLENVGLSQQGTKHHGGATDEALLLYRLCKPYDIKPVPGTHL
jgi:hypothetical protein